MKLTKQKKLTALTLSGGKLSEFGGQEAAKEYRIWFHPKGGGDDFYFRHETLEGLMSLIIGMANSSLQLDSLAKVEAPLAVVWDKAKGDYREVTLC